MDQPPQDHFATAAARLAGRATRAFGWTPDAFWRATPAELATILATDDAAGPTGLGRGELAELMAKLMERDADG